MSKIFALVRATWLTAKSYRLGLVFSLGALLIAFVPLYFGAHALQPIAEESIRQEGGEYFGFLVLGLVATSFITFSMNSLLGAISSGISSGTLEALLATPTRLPTLLTGLMGYSFLQTTVRGLLMVFGIWVVGTPIVWTGAPLAVAVVLLAVHHRGVAQVVPGPLVRHRRSLAI